ncbi:MAG: SRPBCC family protein [Myxococcales bacterium]|nr:SRPBCC family protein [Myxococcales bacterium]
MSKGNASGPAPAIVSTPSDREIRIERVFHAPRARVWRAMTDPKLLAQWWGRGNPLDIERYEFHKGGHWRFVEHADGEAHGFEGRFREIVPLERIALTFEWDGMPGYVVVNTLTLEDFGDGHTRIFATSLFHTHEERDGMLHSGMEDGMNTSYFVLDRLLETLD